MLLPLDAQQSLDVVHVGLHVPEGRGQASFPIAEEGMGSPGRPHIAVCRRERRRAHTRGETHESVYKRGHKGICPCNTDVSAWRLGNSIHVGTQTRIYVGVPTYWPIL